MNDRTSLRLRAQEILMANTSGMTSREAMKRALAERFKDDPAGLLEYAAGASDTMLKGLRQRTYELPELTDDALFDIPPVIAIRTPDGDLFVGNDVALLGQVRQWDREAQQWIAGQRLRRRRFHEQSIEPLNDLPDETPWREARAALVTILGLEAAAGEDES